MRRSATSWIAAIRSASELLPSFDASGMSMCRGEEFTMSRFSVSDGLIGERVVVREFTTDDVDATYAYLSDDEVFRHASWGPLTLDETTESVREAMEAARATPRRDYELAVTLRETGE